MFNATNLLPPRNFWEFLVRTCREAPTSCRHTSPRRRWWSRSMSATGGLGLLRLPPVCSRKDTYRRWRRSPGSGSTNEGPTTAMATRHFESSWVRRRQGEGGGKPAQGSRLAPILSHFLWRPLPGSPSIHLAHALDTFP